MSHSGHCYRQTGAMDAGAVASTGTGVPARRCVIVLGSRQCDIDGRGGADRLTVRARGGQAVGKARRRQCRFGHHQQRKHPRHR